MAAFLNTVGAAGSPAYRRELDLIRVTVVRTLKVRYRGTALGVLWSFANPLMMTLLYAAIFGTAFAAYYGSPLRYMLNAFVGVVVATFFLQATSDALPSIVSNGSLLNKIAIPREVLPLASIASSAFQQCVTTFPLLVLISAVTTHDPLRVILVPVALVALVALAMGFGLALAALFVFFRDLPHLWAIAGFVLWLTSPVFYPSELVPPSVRPWLSLNPIGREIAFLREVVLGNGALHWGGMLATLGLSLAILVVGAALFRSTRSEFMDLL